MIDILRESTTIYSLTAKKIIMSLGAVFDDTSNIKLASFNTQQQHTFHIQLLIILLINIKN